MKIALICPSNILYMPYVGNYERILKENNVDYTIMNWDRFQIEDKNDVLKYRDAKVGHQRNYYDYYKYKKFILEKLNETNFDKLIIYGLQISYFILRYLIKNYKGKYILDIRDHNKITKLFNIKKLVDNSDFVTISSPGYKEWLPFSDKYVINHNTQINHLDEFRPVNSKFEDGKIKICCIGALRDYDINITFINSLKNNDKVNLYYHGEGDINEDIKNYLMNNKIENVFLSGRYNKKDEEGLYTNSDLINVFRYNDSVNNKTALPNRLYNSILFDKPMLALEGTYLAELIKEHRVGLVLDSFNEIEDKINNYIREFNETEYLKGRISFFKQVIVDNDYFSAKLKAFTEVLR